VGCQRGNHWACHFVGSTPASRAASAGTGRKERDTRSELLGYAGCAARLCGDRGALSRPSRHRIVHAWMRDAKRPRLPKADRGHFTSERRRAPGQQMLPRATGPFMRELGFLARTPRPDAISGSGTSCRSAQQVGTGNPTRDHAAINKAVADTPLRSVEVPGVEPGSSVSSSGLLRAQPVNQSRVTATHRRSAATPASLRCPDGPRGPSRR